MSPRTKWAEDSISTVKTTTETGLSEAKIRRMVKVYVGRVRYHLARGARIVAIRRERGDHVGYVLEDRTGRLLGRVPASTRWAVIEEG